MVARDADEPHRAATPLELFFDLVFVVAIAQAAAGLHHGIAEDHIAESIVNYGLVFFAIWWAWMAFTWFATSYDNDDVLYRLAVLLQMTGAVVLAGGVGRAFEDRDFSVVLIGYIIMRVAMIIQVLRSARHNPDQRAGSYRYAGVLALSQLLWAALVLYDPGWLVWGIVALGTFELVSVVWAEQERKSTWHPHHITERYGLLTIIVLGEIILATSLALEAIFDAGEYANSLLPILGGGLLMVFAMWWLYFDEDATHMLKDTKTAFTWGYGHLVIYAAAAAAGAGLAVVLDQATHHAEITARTASFAVAIPAALYVLSVWFLQERTSDSNDGIHLPVAALLLLATPYLPQPTLMVGLILSAAVAIKVWMRVKHAGPAAEAAGS